MIYYYVLAKGPDSKRYRMFNTCEEVFVTRRKFVDKFTNKIYMNAVINILKKCYKNYDFKYGRMN